MPTHHRLADTILKNGKIITVDPTGSLAQAIAIAGPAVQAVGSDPEVMDLSGPETRVIDLQGRTVIPGIIDIHAHLDREGLKNIYPSLAGARSIAEIKDIVRREVDRAKPGEWVTTMPVGDPPNYADLPQSLREGRFPNRWDLDEVSPHNPVYIRGIWTPWNVPPSVSIANSLALEAAGIDRLTQPLDGSVTIERDDSGEPTGIFVDSARYPSVEFTLMKVVPRFNHRDRVAALKVSMRLYNSVGTTGTYEGHGIAPEVLRAYKEVWDAGEMTVRSHLTLSPSWKSAQHAAREMEQWAHTASGAGFGDDLLRISGYYIQYKGSPHTARARSAELPFTGWAGFAESYNPPARFRRLVTLAAQHNLRVNTLVRDTLEDALRVFEEVDRDYPLKGRRWTLAHALEVTSQQMQRIKDLGLVVETIPLTELWLRGGRYLDNPSAADAAVPHRRYLEHQVDFSFGTDNKPYNPFVTLWAAVARKERRTSTVLGPDQRLTRLEALRAFTLGGAYFCFDEGRRGSLEPGKLADLAVLSGDLLSVPEEEIPELHSALTLVGGAEVYRGSAL